MTFWVLNMAMCLNSWMNTVFSMKPTGQPMMPTDEHVEAGAKAIYASFAKVPTDQFARRWNALKPVMKQQYRIEARACLEAMERVG
jgi:hypothetical protein